MKNREKTIKRIICIGLLLILLLFLAITFCGCNKQLIDTTYSFDKAIISLPNGDVVEGEVQSWTDYEDGDQIQVVIDGKTYLVHSSQIVMINE